MDLLGRVKTNMHRTARRAAGVDGITLQLGNSRQVNVAFPPTAIGRSPLRIDLDIIGAWLSTNRPEVGFVQIGAFDGVTNDPLYDLVRRFGWRGVLVEPQAGAFERLRVTYKDIAGVVLLNAAVAEERGSRTLWQLEAERPTDPWWVSQSASFNREHLLAHIAHPYMEQRIVGVDVETLTLADVFSQSPRPVDVLQIDAEGYDAHIVAMLETTGRWPTVVRFEHRHLSLRSHAETVDLLAARGYRISLTEDDTIALRRDRGRGTTAIR